MSRDFTVLGDSNAFGGGLNDDGEGVARTTRSNSRDHFQILRAADSNLQWSMVCFVLLFLIGLTFGIILTLMLSSIQNNQTIHNSDSSATQCADGDASTIDVFIGSGESLCSHYSIPNSNDCSTESASESQCYITGSCVIENGAPTGSCIGECPGTFYSIYPVDCPIPIFITSVQSDINSALLWYFRDCFLGKCRIQVEYTIGDMLDPIGHSAESAINPNFLNALDYDVDREKKCMSLISNFDPAKQCLQAIVHWTFSTVTTSSKFICEFTYKCATHRTLATIGDTNTQTVLFGMKNQKEEEEEETQKRTTNQQNPLVPDPNNIHTFFFPREQVLTMLLNSNMQSINIWWSKVAPLHLNNNNGTNKEPGDKHVGKSAVINILESCMNNLFVSSGVNISNVNELLEISNLTSVAAIPSIMGMASSGQLYDLDYFYSYLYYTYLNGYCFI